jgi:hypothetical protein
LLFKSVQRTAPRGAAGSAEAYSPAETAPPCRLAALPMGPCRRHAGRMNPVFELCWGCRRVAVVAERVPLNLIEIILAQESSSGAIRNGPATPPPLAFVCTF